MALRRSSSNPLIRPQDVSPSLPESEVIGVFNPAVGRIGQDICLVLRVAERPRGKGAPETATWIFDPGSQAIRRFYWDPRDPTVDVSDGRVVRTADGGVCLTSLSTLRLARSRDGIHFDIAGEPLLSPAGPLETFGLEDPRWVRIGNRHLLTFVAVSEHGVTTAAAESLDGRRWHRLGTLFGPENKDIALFPERIDGFYHALHRPSSPFTGRQAIWWARSPDLLHWGDHRPVLWPGHHDWDRCKIGGGAPPIRIEEGWLEIYHGVDLDDRYHLGALLLDADRPWMPRAVSRTPVLSPETPYECQGFWGQVVFSCGAILDEGLLRIYYGAADCCVAYAEVPLQEVLDGLERISGPVPG